MLVAAFRGWNDGAQGASLATSFLAQAWEARRFADIDPEEFYDFQATRPHVALEDGITRRIDWPETAFYHARLPGADRDAVLMLGIEPNLRWRTFSDEIVELAQELGVELVVTLGALLADVPHTRPAPVTGSASDPKLVEELGLAASRYEGPDGDRRRAPRRLPERRAPVREPLGGGSPLRLARREPAGRARALRAAGRPPRHGVRPRRPRARLGGLRAAGQRGVSRPTRRPRRTSSELEARRDALGDELDVPSGDSLAAELTRFLREHEARRAEEDEEEDGA